MKPTPTQEARAQEHVRQAQLTIDEWLNARPAAARGETCEPEDVPRLNAQSLRVYLVLRDLAVHTLRDIASASGDPEASVSARIREIRDYLEEGGKGTIIATRVAGKRGHWTYTMRLARYSGAA